MWIVTCLLSQEVMQGGMWWSTAISDSKGLGKGSGDDTTNGIQGNTTNGAQGNTTDGLQDNAMDGI